MAEPVRGPQEVEVCPAADPEGEKRVLLQLPDRYLLMKPSDARRIAGLLSLVADEVEGLEPMDLLALVDTRGLGQELQEEFLAWSERAYGDKIGAGGGTQRWAFLYQTTEATGGITEGQHAWMRQQIDRMLD
jgi:hypothetical protein